MAWEWAEKALPFAGAAFGGDVIGGEALSSEMQRLLAPTEFMAPSETEAGRRLTELLAAEARRGVERQRQVQTRGAVTGAAARGLLSTGIPGYYTTQIGERAQEALGRQMSEIEARAFAMDIQARQAWEQRELAKRMELARMRHELEMQPGWLETFAQGAMTVGGTILGGTLGGPPGAVAGYQAGQTAGEMIF